MATTATALATRLAFARASLSNGHFIKKINGSLIAKTTGGSLHYNLAATPANINQEEKRGYILSVIRSKRHISKFEYENTFTKLYQFSAEQTSKVSKRRNKWLCTDIDEIMNNAYNLIMEINEGYFETDKEENIAELVNQTLDYLLKLEKPLLILWSVQKYKTKTMVAWSNLVNEEINLLYKMINKKAKYRMKILDYNAINKASFLKNMSDFHAYVYGKVINAPMKYDNSSGALLIRLVDDAFYHLIEANKRIPSNKKELKEREEHISNSISALRKIQRQTLFYFNVMRYSENVLQEWTDYLTQELKLLYALRKSDAERFKNLE